MTLNLADYTSLDGLALASAIRQGELSVAEVIDAARAACSAVNPAINAVLEFYSDVRAPQAAPSGALGGVPILRKDLGATEAGRLQECGSRFLRGNRSTRDSAYVELCRRAGLIFVGRSATPEFGFSSATESVLAGTTRNPWAPARMAGGSSGGAAAAVAAGIVPIAHASDGGGSIRIPASACGIVGLKPSRGRVSGAPHGADALLGLGVEFVVCRSIRDAAAALDILAQPQPGDPFVITASAEPYARLAAASPGALRIAVTTEPWGGVTVDSEIAAAVANAARLCEELGHHVEWAFPRFDFEAMLRVLTDFFAFGIVSLAKDRLAGDPQIGPDTLEPVTLANWELAQRLTAADIEKDRHRVNLLCRAVGAFFERYDVLLTPTLANPPPLHGRYSQSRIDLQPLEYMREMQHTDQFLPIFNVTGQPALSIPIGLSSHGLPIGGQLVGRFANEHTLLALGQQLLRALPKQPRPAIWAGASSSFAAL